MNKIIFLLFLILASPPIVSYYVRLFNIPNHYLHYKYPNCNGCQINNDIYSCDECDNEMNCTTFCTKVNCTQSYYITTTKACRCNKCLVKKRVIVNY